MLNEKATRIYEYIRGRIDEGYAPTVREICTALDIRSTSTVHRYINRLVEEGLLDKMDNQNRAIRLHGHTARSVPVIGQLKDELPLTAVEHIEGYISYVPERTHSGTLFAVRVQDDSLRQAGILRGDVVIGEQTEPAASAAFTIVKTAGGGTAVTGAADDPSGAEVLGGAVALIRYLDR